jgi:hypothetical protein
VDIHIAQLNFNFSIPPPSVQAKEEAIRLITLSDCFSPIAMLVTNQLSDIQKTGGTSARFYF